MRMPFGCHRNKPIDEIPSSYLEWLLTIEIDNDLRARVEEALAQRSQVTCEGSEVVKRSGELSEVIRSWYREITLQFHPDRGGRNEAMVAITVAHERLRELLEVQ